MRGWVMVAVIGLGTLLLVVLGIRALLRGRSVPTKAKLAVAGAIVWLVSPIDVIPDFIPALGVLDDVAVLIATVRYVLEHMEPNREPNPPVEQRLDRHRTIDVSDWRISDDPPDP